MSHPTQDLFTVLIYRKYKKDNELLAQTTNTDERETLKLVSFMLRNQINKERLINELKQKISDTKKQQHK